MKSADLINSAHLTIAQAIRDKNVVDEEVNRLKQEVEYATGIAQSFLDEADASAAAAKTAAVIPAVASAQTVAPAAASTPIATPIIDGNIGFNTDQTVALINDKNADYSSAPESAPRNYNGSYNSNPSYEADRENRSRTEALKRVVQNYAGDDTVSIVSYLKQFQMVRQAYSWSDSLAGFHLVRALTGKAVRVLRDMKETDRGYDAVSKALIDTFEPATQVDAYRNQFEYRMRDSQRETPHQYAEVLKTLASKAFSFMDPAIKEYLVRKQFEKGQSLEVRRMLASNPDLETVDRSVGMVSKYEACLSTESLLRVGTKPRENPHVPTVNITEVQECDSPLEESYEVEYDTNYAQGKFNPARKPAGSRPSYTPKPRNSDKNQSDSIRRLEDRMNAMVKALESSNMGHGIPASPSFGLSQTVNSVGHEEMEEAPTAHELMVLITGPPPKFQEAPVDSTIICWFCHVKGHRRQSCDLFRKWLNDRRDDKAGPIPPMQGKKGN